MNFRKYVQRSRYIWTSLTFFWKWKLGYSFNFFTVRADAIRIDKLSQYFYFARCKSAFFLKIQYQPSSAKALKDLVEPM